MQFKIHSENRELVFINVPLRFEFGFEKNVFSKKKDKSVRETLAGAKYARFSQKVLRNYAGSLDKPLGEFLAQLKEENNIFYKDFLNPHGDKRYCTFSIDDPGFIDARGLYCFLVDGKIKYIGRCLDSFRKRINQGYGKIHPKNCYIDGQSTNCHLNSMIASNLDRVTLFICKMDDDKEIEYMEKVIIKKEQPEWNVTFKI